MDPITHGVIGLALSSFSGQAVALSNPVSVGCALGAMSPDLDVVVRIFKNDMVYLKHHRGVSHSLPVLAPLSAAIALAVSALYPGSDFVQILLWTFIGAVSHTVFDVLNSYGAMLLTKKRKANLLTLYDPVISLVALSLILYPGHSNWLSAGGALVTVLYMAFRWRQKNQATAMVRAHFEKSYRILDITVMPSLKLFYKWDFVIATKSHSLVGKINGFTGELHLIETLPNAPQDMVALFKSTKVGRYFEDFTPNYHLVPTAVEKGVLLKAIDLRYHFRNDFLHHATLYLDHDLRVQEGHFRPYKYSKKIVVPEAA